jgi:hypothetical protein
LHLRFGSSVWWTERPTPSSSTRCPTDRKQHFFPSSSDMLLKAAPYTAYINLNDHGFNHFTVIHKYSFKKIYVNQSTKEEITVHTNRMEGAWKHAKAHFRYLM